VAEADAVPRFLGEFFLSTALIPCLRPRIAMIFLVCRLWCLGP
jgi:hypothetical protein